METCPHEWVAWRRDDAGSFYVREQSLWVPELASGMERVAEFCVHCHVVRNKPGSAPETTNDIWIRGY